MGVAGQEIAKRELALIGKYDGETEAQWASLIGALRDGGLIEVEFDGMQGDMVVRAYQRFLQLDQVEYDLLANFMEKSESDTNVWYAEEKKKLDDWFECGKLHAEAYALLIGKLNEAKLARFSNLHNLLAVINKAKFNNGTFFNKAGVVAAFSRTARKNYGATTGHDMERLVKALENERDERAVQTTAVDMTDAEDAVIMQEDAGPKTEVDAAMEALMFQDIRAPINEKGE